MTPSKLLVLAAATAAAAVPLATPADAFWAARGWRGGVAVGGIRPPVVARDYYYPACMRCAPVYPAGAAVAGAALAGAAVGAAAASSAAASAPPPAATQASTSTTTTKSTTTQTSKTTTVAATSTSAADTCAKGLPADSKMIYDATIKNMKGIDTLRDTVTEQTRSMVMAGKINQANARPAAEAAGSCLKLLAKS